MNKPKVSAKEKQLKKSVTGEMLYRFPVAYLALFALIFIVYGNTLSFTLGKLDETNIILDKLDFLRSLKNLKEVLVTNPFFNRGGDFYRPLQNLSFMIDANLSGPSGWAYYLSNILIHFFTCSLIYYLVTLFGKDRKTALLLTMIFAVHPLFVQTVAWAPSRGDLLLAMFGVASFICFVRYIRENKKLFLALCILGFGLALMSKETAVMIPVICLLYYLFVEKEKSVGLTGLIIPAVSCVALFVLFMVVRNEVVRTVVEKNQFGLIPFLIHLRTIPDFIAKFFFPVDLGPMPAFSAFLSVTGTLILALLIFISIRDKSGSLKFYLFWLIWFLLFIVPAITYINKFGSAACDYMEHRAYVPLIGILVMVYRYLTTTPQVKENKTIRVILIGIIPFFALYTHIYAGNYRTPMSYYDLAVKNNPASAIAYSNRGTTRMNENKDYRGAIDDFNRCLAMYPGHEPTYNNRGYCREQLHDTAGAMADYIKAAQLKPGWSAPHINMASLERSMGMFAEAIREYDTVIAFYPAFYQAYGERGDLKREAKDYEGSLYDLNEAIRLHQNYPEAYFNRGLLAIELQQLQGAIGDFDMAIRLNGRYAEAYVNRGIVKYRLQDYQGAISDFNNALQINDQYAEAYMDRGMAFFMIKDTERACRDWEAAGKLGMADAESLLRQYGNR